MINRSILVAQLGARMHYAVPRILQDEGLLSLLHTDICAIKGWPAALRKLVPGSFRPSGLQRFLGRVPHGIPANKIRAYNQFGWEYARRRQAARTPPEMTAVHLWAGENFCRRIIDYGLGDADSVYTFNSAGLELLQEAKRRGLMAVMEQTIAPQTIEREFLDPEYARFPEMRGMIEPVESWKRFADREAAEWDAADLILCGSQFVVDGIRTAGGPAEKAMVVPYGVDLSNFTSPACKLQNGSALTVLFVGQVGIRKGAHYLIDAARLLEKSHPKIQFKLVGTIALPGSMLTSLPTNVQLTGPIPRTEIREQFAQADLFCLPSLCEGSATVVYEALAVGLPVICTPNTGSVVRDGKDGFIVPIRDAMALAKKIALLAGNVSLCVSMSHSAVQRSTEFSLAQYADRLRASLMFGPNLK